METYTSQSENSDSNNKSFTENAVEPSVSLSNMPTEKIQGIVELEKLKIQSQTANLAFKERQLSTNLELAKLQINLRADIENKRHGETRKTVTLFGVGALLLVFIIIAFIGWCLSIGKEQFVIDLLKYSLYPLSAGGGYWAGRTSRRPHSDESSA